MDLGIFIMGKQLELKQNYSFAEIDSYESVVLSKNSVSQQFNSTETSLLQTGKEVKVSEIGEYSSIPFVPNGTLVRFAVKLPRKRKTTKVDFYFLWDK